MSTVSQPHAPSSSAPSKAALWTGRVLSALTILFMLFDAFGKFAKPVQVTDAFTKLGLPISTSVTIGVLITICTVLYAIPRTAVLGAVLLTGFLGGAVAIQLRAGSPTFETWFPVIFAAIAWLGTYLRYPALKVVLPLC
ncbi:DoxX family protein [Occallatibacter riparius]|uniref:DoxX family protein n=1 Tax=Occallatibacter riparius TaxID=1002689 RepID=A0A9J7BJD2_9BACT|nr:DoxX family protein [Occallatibacter riparius]UWZ83020.1 DoxX family protein [Occallatibacter riparius]